MITAGDFKKGITVEMDNGVWTIVDFQHVKPGKGAAFVRTRIKNVMTGAVTETTFNPTAKYPTAFIERKKLEYSYNDGGIYYFMDMETYDMTLEMAVAKLMWALAQTKDPAEVTRYFYPPVANDILRVPGESL